MQEEDQHEVTEEDKDIDDEDEDDFKFYFIMTFRIVVKQILSLPGSN